MPAVSGEIPLLPLPVVLFPGTFLPLQVDEEAHRSLLRQCVDGGHHLGVIFSPGASPQGQQVVPCTTGCLASIALLIRESDDCDDEPLSAVLYGEQRIRVLDFVQQDPYLTGRFEVLAEDTGYETSRRIGETINQFHQYLDLIRARYQADIADVELPDDPTMASYLLSSVLHLPLRMKQRWLESPSTAVRLKEQLAYLRDECEKLSALQMLARQAARNYSLPGAETYTPFISHN